MPELDAPTSVHYDHCPLSQRSHVSCSSLTVTLEPDYCSPLPKQRFISLFVGICRQLLASKKPLTLKKPAKTEDSQKHREKQYPKTPLKQLVNKCRKRPL